jgi:hypothetical protein
MLLQIERVKMLDGFSFDVNFGNEFVFHEARILENQ